MVVIFQPKQTFIESSDAKVFREMTGHSAFLKGALHGLQHYSDTLTRTTDGDPSTKFAKIQGAREFLGVLLNLTEVVETPTKTPVKQLNPNV